MFRRLAGVGAKRRQPQEEEDVNPEDIQMEGDLPDEGEENIDDFEMGEDLPEDDYVDEYQNRLDSPDEDVSVNPENVRIDQEEAEPEIEIEDEDF